MNNRNNTHSKRAISGIGTRSCSSRIHHKQLPVQSAPVISMILRNKRCTTMLISSMARNIFGRSRPIKPAFNNSYHLCNKMLNSLLLNSCSVRPTRLWRIHGLCDDLTESQSCAQSQCAIGMNQYVSLVLASIDSFVKCSAICFGMTQGSWVGWQTRL